MSLARFMNVSRAPMRRAAMAAPAMSYAAAVPKAAVHIFWSHFFWATHGQQPKIFFSWNHLNRSQNRRSPSSSWPPPPPRSSAAPSPSQTFSAWLLPCPPCSVFNTRTAPSVAPELPSSVAPSPPSLYLLYSQRRNFVGFRFSIVIMLLIRLIVVYFWL